MLVAHKGRAQRVRGAQELRARCVQQRVWWCCRVHGDAVVGNAQVAGGIAKAGEGGERAQLCVEGWGAGQLGVVVQHLYEAGKETKKWRTSSQKEMNGEPIASVHDCCF